MTLKQMTKNKKWKPKISCKLAQNFVKCSHISFFSLSTKLFRVICQTCKYFHHLSLHQYLLFCYLRHHWMKLQCDLTWPGKSCECHPAHSFLLIISGGYMLLFHQTTRIIYCLWHIFSTSFMWYLQTLRTFLIHKEQFAFPVHALRIIIKLDFGELWAGSSLVKPGSFNVLRHNADCWSCVQTLPRTRLRLCSRQRGTSGSGRPHLKPVPPFNVWTSVCCIHLTLYF